MKNKLWKIAVFPTQNMGESTSFVGPKNHSWQELGRDYITRKMIGNLVLKTSWW